MRDPLETAVLDTRRRSSLPVPPFSGPDLQNHAYRLAAAVPRKPNPVPMPAEYYRPWPSPAHSASENEKRTYCSNRVELQVAPAQRAEIRACRSGIAGEPRARGAIHKTPQQISVGLVRQAKPICQ